MSTESIKKATERLKPAPAWANLAALLPIEDFTRLGEEQRARPPITVRAHRGDRLLIRPDPYDAAARTLYRTRCGNVLLTGRKGVGKTTFVRELARRAVTGEIPFLTGRRFVWIDCRNVGPEDSRACLESIFTAVATTPDVILCLDGLAALLKRTHGGTNKPLLRAMLGREAPPRSPVGGGRTAHASRVRYGCG